jgi:hypothetical protein
MVTSIPPLLEARKNPALSREDVVVWRFHVKRSGKTHKLSREVLRELHAQVRCNIERVRVGHRSVMHSSEAA